MFVSSGARRRMRTERKKAFVEQYVTPLIREAAKLGISPAGPATNDRQREQLVTTNPGWDDALCRELLAAFDLPTGRLVKKLSRGIACGLGIVVGIASRAPVTIFAAARLP